MIDCAVARAKHLLTDSSRFANKLRASAAWICRPEGAMCFAARPAWRYRTSEPDWGIRAVEDLVNLEDVIIDGIYVAAHSLEYNRPTWGQLRRVLLDHGIKVPRRVPGDITTRRGRHW
jgi:hypothetical protein